MFADTTLLDIAVVVGMVALVCAAATRRPVTVGCKVRIVAADDRQNAFIGETGTVAGINSIGVYVTLDDLGPVPFDPAEVRRIGWWSL